MAVDGLAATTVLRGELDGSLFARAVGRPKRWYIEPFSVVKTLAAITAFVPLFAILSAVFFDLLRAAKKAFWWCPKMYAASNKSVVDIEKSDGKCLNVIEHLLGKTAGFTYRAAYPLA